MEQLSDTDSDYEHDDEGIIWVSNLLSIQNYVERLVNQRETMTTNINYLIHSMISQSTSQPKLTAPKINKTPKLQVNKRCRVTVPVTAPSFVPLRTPENLFDDMEIDLINEIANF